VTDAGDASFSLTHEVGHGLEVRVGGVPIASYSYDGDLPALESPKPYLHPLRTLSGAVVSAYRPWDHPWHKGLQMTASVLSGQNFWGGGTYTDGEYVVQDNIGRIRHDSFTALRVRDDEATVRETLSWITARGERWLEEERTLRFWGADPAEGVWVLDFETRLRNVRGSSLRLGSPTTLGRPDAGYGGFFWRGPRSWTGAEIVAPGGEGGEAMRGRSADWLAIAGRHDGIDGGATVLMFAGTSSGMEPLSWFVRSTPFAALNPSPSFHREVAIVPGEALELRHRLVIADRMWGRAEVEERAQRHAL
jgi:hypothetical protein